MRKHTKLLQSPGFTIVELLIVIMVIAILAAISIAGYNGIQNRSYESIVEQDLASVIKKLELAKVYLGRYPRLAATEFQADFKFSKSAYSSAVHNVLYCINHTTDEYAVGVTAKSGMRYLLTQSQIQKNVSVSPDAVCQAVGTGWTTPTAPRTAIHGYLPGGTLPTYTDSWFNYWSWTE